MFALLLAAEEEEGVRASERQNLSAHQTIIDQNIGLGDEAGGFDGKKIGIAWTGARKIYLRHVNGLLLVLIQLL